MQLEGRFVRCRGCYEWTFPLPVHLTLQLSLRDLA
jgi:hypothetical protein